MLDTVLKLSGVIEDSNFKEIEKGLKKEFKKTFISLTKIPVGNKNIAKYYLLLNSRYSSFDEIFPLFFYEEIPMVISLDVDLKKGLLYLSIDEKHQRYIRSFYETNDYVKEDNPELLSDICEEWEIILNRCFQTLLKNGYIFK